MTPVLQNKPLEIKVVNVFFLAHTGTSDIIELSLGGLLNMLHSIQMITM